MFFVAINGSPNKDGNTVFLLKKGLEQLELMGAQTELIHTQEVLKSVKVPFCTVCSAICTGACLKGTLMEEVLQKLREADGLLIGSPVYFGTVSGQLKAFWDKLRCLRSEKKLLNVVGGAVAVGASRFGGQEGTLRAIHEMMLVQGMTIIGDGQKDNDCGHYGVAAQRPATEDQYAQQRMIIMAKRLFEVSQATQNLRL
ncbi:MAG: flavodoxin family protein [Clostridia bacterium]|jgi:multimeric flavodoxin WrbA|nr:flavodoxin family protein [Clostridia bacterium]